MANADKILCPYCGGEMELVRYGFAYWYECMRAGCRTHSPAAGTERDALEAARKRVKVEGGAEND